MAHGTRLVPEKAIGAVHQQKGPFQCDESPGETPPRLLPAPPGVAAVALRTQ